MRLSKKRWYVEPMSENECRGQTLCLPRTTIGKRTKFSKTLVRPLIGSFSVIV
jgi:hypothetical protein